MILVIDNDTGSRRAKVRTLEEAGFQVLVGGTAAEAIELTRRRRPALVLLSIVLPDGNGVDVADELKRDPSLAGTFVILMCGTRTDLPEQAEAGTQHVADCATGPSGKVEFLAQLDSFLQIRAGQEALRDSEERYRALFDRSRDCVYLTDGRGHFLDANQAGLDLLGYRREEIATLTIQSLLTEDQIPLALRTTQEILTTGRQQRLAEYRLRRKDGGCVFVETTGSLIYREGKPFAIQGIARDITERKKAQEALRESEERFRRMFQHSAAGMVLVSPDFRFIEVNPAFCKMLGYTETELIGKAFQDITLPEDRPGGAELTGRVLSGETEMFHFEKRYLHKDGTVVWGLVSSTLIRDTRKQPLYFVTQILNITKRKQAEEALRDSESRLLEAQEVGHTGYLDWDIRTSKIVWSDETCRIYGFEPGACAPTLESTVALVPPEDRELVERQLAIALGGGPDYDIEHRVLRPDGQVIHVHARARVTRGPDGTPLRMLGTVVDITERKRIEEENKRLQLQLAQAQKMECIGRLAGGVAHDFNNLLTVINGYAAFLTKELPPRDPLRRYAMEIGEAGERAASLTSQLLAFSRKQAIMPKAVNLNAVIADAERMLHRLIGEDVELVSSLAPRLGYVMADPDQIHQVIMNLAVNARDAMPNGGKFEIATAEVELDETTAASHPDAAPGRHVQVTVTDNGTGMTEEVRQRIFEPFFTTKEQGQGTGLGMATVYGILRQNNGWIEVQSEIGRGSTFRIYLPRIDAGAADGQAKPAASNVSHGNETVLIVEDQEAVRRLAKMILEAHGYRVLEAGGGVEAQAAARRHAGKIDLLLTDVVMPGMDGFLLSEQLRDLRPNLRVLMMSGYADDVLAHRDALARGLACIQKPFGPHELAAKVREILDSPVRS
ncbi:MAG: PAS domain S-box protein [Acidobacteriia bacterium]|nr:PAS domain S-box protein [Terriglobia bacterium]